MSQGLTTEFEEIGIGLSLWDGVFEGKQHRWLGGRDRGGLMIPTGAERGPEECRWTGRAGARVYHLAEKLRSLVIDPDV